MFATLSKIFENQQRLKLLKFFIFQPQSRFTAHAAGSALGISKTSAEKEARTLLRLGFLSERKRAHGNQYALQEKNPFIEPLRVFLDATTLPDDKAILSAFKGVFGISLLVASGTLVREERASADLLVVVRKSKHQAVARAVARLEHLFGLPLRYAVLEPISYGQRLEGNDRMLRDVFEFHHRVILGKP